jgi:large subunit ribosomal protein L30
MSFDKILNKKIILTQVKSDNKLVERQKSTLRGLGLRGVNTKSELLASNDVLGMIKKVTHLVKVSDI